MSQRLVESWLQPRRVIARGVVLGMLSVIALAVPARIASAVVPNPTVEGPITGGNGEPFLASTEFFLTDLGYDQQEYFISGTASGYTSSDTLSPDGKWTATPSGSAAYKTRVLVYLPTSPRKFKGTVVVEWFNVSGGVDAAPDWVAMHTEMIRAGWGWVGVSAQAVGVEGGTTIFGVPAIAPLKTVDPVRYGSLSHPGDSFSYDIFSQVAQAIRHPSGVSLLGALAPKLKTLLADGDSQSAFRLVTYVNAIQPQVGLYDGFYVHSRGGIGAPLSEAPQPSIPVLDTAPVRDDLAVPVLLFQTETDMATLNYFPARQPDSAMIRVWEVAGTAHIDAYGLAYGPLDEGRAALDTTYSAPVLTIPGAGITCDQPINAGPQHYVESAAIWALNRWVQKAIPAPTAPRLDVQPGPPPTISRDSFGNAVGGIRTPQVDAPIAALAGDGQTGSAFCFLFGTTTPLDAPTLASLYPTHAAYVSAVAKSKRAAIKAGFLLGVDARAIRAAAAKSDVGR